MIETLLLKEIFGRPIAFHRSLVPFAGITGAVFLSQAIYWEKTLEDTREGWFYKTQKEWEDETGIKKDSQESCRKKLLSIGLLEEKREEVGENKWQRPLWYRVNFEKLRELLLSNAVNTRYRTRGITANDSGITPPSSNTENTTKNTHIEKILNPTVLEEQVESAKDSEKSCKDGLSEYLNKKTINQAKKDLKKKYGGHIPPFVDVEKEISNVVPEIVSVTITRDYRDFCEFISKDRRAIHIPTTNGQKLWDKLLLEGYLPAHIKCASRIAYKTDEFWKNNFTPELFFRKKSSTSGEALDNIGKFVNYRADENPELVKIKQEMKHELEQE